MKGQDIQGRQASKEEGSMVGRARREVCAASVAWELNKMRQGHSRVQSEQGLLSSMWSLDFIQAHWETTKVPPCVLKIINLAAMQR